MEFFTCEACGERFHVDAHGWDSLCIDCTADRSAAFADLECDREFELVTMEMEHVA